MQSIQCISCKHFRYGNTWKAFKLIPDEIYLGLVTHNKPYPGDKGYRYEVSEHYKAK